MFIEIAEHAGVEKRDNDGDDIWEKEFITSKISLNQIIYISFYKNSEDSKDVMSFIFADDNTSFFLKFSNEGMGEYKRIKRILDDKTIR